MSIVEILHHYGAVGGVTERRETRRETEICDFTENSFWGERSGLWKRGGSAGEVRRDTP